MKTKKIYFDCNKLNYDLRKCKNNSKNIKKKKNNKLKN